MTSDLKGEDFDRKIQKAKTEGIAGRKELLESLTKMPMEKVVQLPASSLAILGPQGLAQLAARREELAGAGRQHTTRVIKHPTSPTGKSSTAVGGHPLRSTAFSVLAILAVGLLADVARPVLVPAFLDPGVRPRQTSRWPACRRLDHHVDGCVYTTGGEKLSLQHAADLTGISTGHLLSANRHLTASPDVVLPKGSAIVIWRGRLKLSGASQ